MITAIISMLLYTAIPSMPKGEAILPEEITVTEPRTIKLKGNGKKY